MTDQGYLSFTCISTTDEHYGQGEFIGKNTYRMTDGKEIHFFDEAEIVSLLEGKFNIEVIQLINQEEPNSNGQLETLALRYIVAQKKRIKPHNCLAVLNLYEVRNVWENCVSRTVLFSSSSSCKELLCLF